MEQNDDFMKDMQVAMSMLPAIAGAIRKLRMQKMVEDQAQKSQLTQPPLKESPRYQQNKWEVSPSG